MSDHSADKLAIRELVDNWVLYRDAGDWERFATVWHADGWMTATWFQGPAAEFIEASRRLFDQGGNILHLLGGWTCDISGDRANSQVKMTRVEADANANDFVALKRLLDGEGTSQPAVGTSEGHHVTVAAILHDAPAVGVRSHLDDGVVGAEDLHPPRVAELLGEGRRVLDVGEHERHPAPGVGVGGDVRVLTQPTDEWHLDPQPLPGGPCRALFYSQGAQGHAVEAIELDGGRRTKILDNASHGRYLASGDLLFVRGAPRPNVKNRVAVSTQTTATDTSPYSAAAM